MATPTARLHRPKAAVAAELSGLTPGTALGGVLVLVLGLSPVAAAQEFPDPGLLQRDLLRERERFEERIPEEEEPEGPVLEAPDAEPPRLPDTDVRFLLRGIRFPESEFIAEERLRGIAGDYVGREVTFRDLDRLVDRINALYRRAGIVTARAMIPPQQVEGGVVEVLLVEGRLGELRFSGNDYLRDGFLRRRLPLEPGEVIDPRRLESALNRFNRTEDSRLQASLRPGEEFGESDVSVDVDEPPRWVAQLSVDNAGAPTTGEEQGGLLFSWYSPLGFGDRFTAFVSGAEGARTGDVLYGFPVNHRGGRLELRYAVSDIEVVKGPLRDLEIEGDSRTARVRFVQPIVRGDRWWWDGFLGGERLSSSSTVDGVEFSDNTVEEVFLATRLVDRGLGWGYFGYQWSLEPRVSAFRFEDSTQGDEEEGVIYGALATWQQRLGEHFYGTLTAEGQYTPEPEDLPSARLFRVGGATTVRGYEDGIAAGERGAYASLQLNWRPNPRVQPFVFVDHGHVDPLAQESESLTGAGAGVYWRWGSRLSGEVAYGHAYDELVPDQDDYRIHFRAVLQLGAGE